MHILIVEDEASVAQRLERFIKQVLGSKLARINCCPSISSARDYLHQHSIDILMLDLNLNGKDGFKMLEEMVAQSFHTIIVSAYTDKAIEAFEYGVLDFVPKPFTIERLEKAFDRVGQSLTQGNELRYLSVKVARTIKLIPIEQLQFAKAAGNYTELHLLDGKMYLHDKNLQRLSELLPDHFCRIHRSYLVDRSQIKAIINHGAGKYEADLGPDLRLPISRHKMHLLR